MANDEARESLLALLEAKATIGGRFEQILRLGASGGNGHFSLMLTAHDQATSKPVALKFFNPLRMDDSYRWECFKREAEILEKLGSPRDVIGYAASRAEFTEHLRTPQGLVFPLTMSYFGLELAASSVAEMIAAGAWTAEQKLTAFRAMCRGVQRIHCRQIAHRDLKPHNFLVMHDGTVRLSDFGTACVLDGDSPRLALSYPFHPGDYRYAAPEVIACLHDEDPDIAYGADSFALGAILFELFTGAILTLQVFDEELVEALMEVVNLVPKGRRKGLYDRAVQSLADGHRLPSMGAYGTGAPLSIRDRLDGLYQALAALDYRARLQDFARVFNQVDTCVLILRNEAKYRHWRDERRRRAAAKKPKGSPYD